jgi:hypothetical protein
LTQILTDRHSRLRLSFGKSNSAYYAAAVAIADDLRALHDSHRASSRSSRCISKCRITGGGLPRPPTSFSALALPSAVCLIPLRPPRLVGASAEG